MAVTRSIEPSNCQTGFGASPCDPQTCVGAIRLTRTEHQLPPLCERPGPDPHRIVPDDVGACV